VSYPLYIIIHDLSSPATYTNDYHIVPYLIKPYDQTITIIFNFYRVDSELSGNTIFDITGPVYLLKNLVEKRLFCIWYNGSLDFVITRRSGDYFR